MTREQALAAGPLSSAEAEDLANLLTLPHFANGGWAPGQHPRVKGLALRAALCGLERERYAGLAHGMHEVAAKMARA